MTKILKKLNFFDLLLLLACVAIVYAAYLFSMPQQAVAESGQRIRFTVELSNFSAGAPMGLPAGFHEQIVPGPMVLESRNSIPIGYVVGAYGLPFMREVPDEAANIIRRAYIEEQEFAYVVIEARADVTDMITEVNGVRIVVNQDIYVRSRDFAGSGFITHLEFLD